MKIAVSSSGSDLDSGLDPRFGRCAYFLIVETEDNSFQVLDNAAAAAGGGAGIQAARAVAQSGAQVLITGNCGPNAHQTLTAAGIAVFNSPSGTVAEAVDRFRSGELQEADGPNVGSHAGIG